MDSTNIKEHRVENTFNGYYLRYTLSSSEHSREWILRDESERRCLNSERGPEAIKTYRTDHIMTSYETEQDIYRCFCHIGICSKEEIIPELFACIYNTPVDPNVIKEIRDFGCTRDLTRGIVNTNGDENDLDTNNNDFHEYPVPKTYADIFAVIGELDDKEYMKRGFSCEWKYKTPTTFEWNDKQYTLYQYPDSVILSMELKDGVLYFGYGR